MGRCLRTTVNAVREDHNNMKSLASSVTLLLAVLIGAPASAGIFGSSHDDGIAAFQRGDYEGARENLLDAATKTDPEAYYYLGLLYHKGLGGLPKNDDNAFRLIKAAANLDYAPACLELARWYRQGGGRIQRNMSMAIIWLEHAAKLNVVEAQLQLGDIYLKGDGVLADEGIARHWLELAASGGNGSARELLQSIGTKPSPGPSQVATSSSGLVVTPNN